jgi:hypothetical protein
MWRSLMWAGVMPAMIDDRILRNRVTEKMYLPRKPLLRSVTVLILLCIVLLATVACDKEEDKKGQDAMPVDSLALDKGNWRFMLSREEGEERTYYYFYGGDLLGINPEGNVTLWQKSLTVPVVASTSNLGSKSYPYELSRIEVSQREV